MTSWSGPGDLLIAAFAIAAVISSLFFVFMYRGWMLAMRRLPTRTEKRGVSVVVAAHDEEARIGALLEALCAQDYPPEKFEVIVVDDRSADGTADIALSFQDRLPLRLLRVDETPAGVSPKKFALHQGITSARNGIILLTDADCLPRSSWIAGMNEALAHDRDVVIGPAPLVPAREAAAGFATAYAAFESRRTATLAIAAAASGVPYMASGRSWGFTRAVYERCGGLPALYAHLGGDDDLLLQRMIAHGASVGFCTRQDAIVTSPAPATWQALTRQKQRHYRVSSAYRGKASLLLGIFVLSELLTPLLAIALTVALEGPARILPLVFWLWKLWYDAGFLVHAARWMDGDARRTRLVFWEGFHIFFSALTGAMSFVKPPRW